jgi:hypothetical protein
MVQSIDIADLRGLWRVNHSLNYRKIVPFERPCFLPEEDLPGELFLLRLFSQSMDFLELWLCLIFPY